MYQGLRVVLILRLSRVGITRKKQMSTKVRGAIIKGHFEKHGWRAKSLWK